MHIGRACLTNFLTNFFDAFFYEFSLRIFFTCILEENFVHVCRCILEELVMRIEDNDRDFTVAQNAQLVGFFHQTKLSLGESDLTIPLVCTGKSLSEALLFVGHGWFSFGKFHNNGA